MSKQYNYVACAQLQRLIDFYSV